MVVTRAIVLCYTVWLILMRICFLPPAITPSEESGHVMCIAYAHALPNKVRGFYRSNPNPNMKESYRCRSTKLCLGGEGWVHYHNGNAPIARSNRQALCPSQAPSICVKCGERKKIHEKKNIHS